VTTSAATHQSHCFVRHAAAGATTSLVTTKFRKCVASMSSKVSPSDCVHNPEVVTRDPSIIFGSLERALCSLTEVGKSLMELQKALQESFRGHPYLLAVSLLSLFMGFPALRSSFSMILLKSCLISILRDSKLGVHFREYLPVLAILR
jgi:hypothetical protein